MRKNDAFRQQVHRVLLALKQPIKLAGGTARLARRLGMPAKQIYDFRDLKRPSIRLDDYLRLCAAADVEPGTFLDRALSGEDGDDVPRLCETARRLLSRARRQDPGRELSGARLRDLHELALQDPAAARAALRESAGEADGRSSVRLAGILGTAYRIAGELGRSELILRKAIELVRKPGCGFEGVEGDLLVRLAHVELDRHGPFLALRTTTEAVAAAARDGNDEGVVAALLTRGKMNAHAGDPVAAARDLLAVTRRDAHPHDLYAAHQGLVIVYLDLKQREAARRHVAEARQRLPGVDWMAGKLCWAEAKLATTKSERIEKLTEAQARLCPSRRSDCALVTAELVEALDAAGRGTEAASHVGELKRQLFELSEDRSLLTAARQLKRPADASGIRELLDRVLDQRTARMVGDE